MFETPDRYGNVVVQSS